MTNDKNEKVLTISRETHARAVEFQKAHRLRTQDDLVSVLLDIVDRWAGNGVASGVQGGIAGDRPQQNHTTEAA